MKSKKLEDLDLELRPVAPWASGTIREAIAEREKLMRVVNAVRNWFKEGPHPNGWRAVQNALAALDEKDGV